MTSHCQFSLNIIILLSILLCFESQVGVLLVCLVLLFLCVTHPKWFHYQVKIFILVLNSISFCFVLFLISLHCCCLSPLLLVSVVILLCCKSSLLLLASVVVCLPLVDNLVRFYHYLSQMLVVSAIKYVLVFVLSLLLFGLHEKICSVQKTPKSILRLDHFHFFPVKGKMIMYILQQ